MKPLLPRIHWHLNDRITRNLWLLNLVGGKLSVVSTFVTPGDTMLTGAVCRNIKRRFPRIRINGVVRQPELLQHDPHLDSLNAPPGAWVLRFDYLDILSTKDGRTNLLKPMMSRVGIRGYEYQCRVFLTAAELAEGRQRLGQLQKPVITINASSREKVKMWREDHWRTLVARLQPDFDLVQLGDDGEPAFDGVTSFAGKLSLRQSMAVLAQARAHVGIVSFLMHAANGLDVPSVIIYGGREKPANSGYGENLNLASSPPCSPCWLHATKGEQCQHDMQCMAVITPEQVFESVQALLAGRRRPRSLHPSAS